MYTGRMGPIAGIANPAARDTSETITLVLNGAHARDIVTVVTRPLRETDTAIDPIAPSFLEIDDRPLFESVIHAFGLFSLVS